MTAFSAPCRLLPNERARLAKTPVSPRDPRENTGTSARGELSSEAPDITIMLFERAPAGLAPQGRLRFG